MAEFPTYEQMAKNVAEKALDEILYDGKSIREWMKIIIEQEPCEDAVSRDMALEKMADYVSSGNANSVEDFEEYSKIICQLPSVQPKTDRIEYGTDGNPYRLSISNGKEYEQEPKTETCEDCISRAELLKAIDTWDKFGIDDTNHLFRLDNLSLPHYVPYIHYDDVIKCIKDLPSVQPDTWHDPEDPPDNDRYILIHFSNFSLPQIGRYEGDPEHGGNYYLGDETETALSQYLYVNGWMEIPTYPEDNT